MAGRELGGREKGAGGEDVCVSYIGNVGEVEEIARCRT